MTHPIEQTTITILGAGYVGLTTGALLACAGLTVYIVEPNTERRAAIAEGRSFFFEAGLDPLVAHAVTAGTLIPTDSYADGVPRSQIVISCVGTPDNPDGSSDLSYIFAAAESALPHLQPGSVYVQKSTVPVGTGTRIEQLFQDHELSVPYVSNPEFLREGSALADTLYFDRVVAGGRDSEAVERILQLYQHLEIARDDIAGQAGLALQQHAGRYIATSLSSAELIKVTANAFLALKISFANSIAQLADTVDADITDVMDAVGADTRIGRSFLNAGRGYGGGCFPKDVSGLIASAHQQGVDIDIMTAAQAVNDSMPRYIIDKLARALPIPLSSSTVAVLGLAFKGGTSDARRSPGIAIANLLQEKGATVTAYDPEANHEAKAHLAAAIRLDDSLRAAITGADAVIIAAEWPEFITLPAATYKATMTGTLIVDAVNQLDKDAITDSGLRYIGVGR